jgi:hypothetical protein
MAYLQGLTLCLLQPFQADSTGRLVIPEKSFLPSMGIFPAHSIKVWPISHCSKITPQYACRSRLSRANLDCDGKALQVPIIGWRYCFQSRSAFAGAAIFAPAFWSACQCGVTPALRRSRARTDLRTPPIIRKLNRHSALQLPSLCPHGALRICISRFDKFIL